MTILEETCPFTPMANRLSVITTRTGDDGTTGLGDGSRVSKHHARVVAMGDVDELNSCLGVLLAEPLPEDLRALLIEVQHDLFDLGGELSTPGFELIKHQRVIALDQAIETYNAQLPRLAEFILPGGCRASALAHVARTIARRAERSVVHLMTESSVRQEAPHYLNRLSDLLFVLARVLNRSTACNGPGHDVLWNRSRD
jgi:cob(I)alamin adenosyltransferase